MMMMMKDWVNGRDDVVDGVDRSSLPRDDLLEARHLLVQRHRQLMPVLGRPAPELRMPGDEVCFLLELSTDDVLHAALIEVAVDDDQVGRPVSDHGRRTSSVVRQ